MPIAQAFHMGGLPTRVRLEEIATVVDGANFWTDFDRSDLIEDGEGNPVEAPLAPLLVDQLEYTNVVLLNKTDLADAADSWAEAETEIVFIGRGMPVESIVARLDRCFDRK